MRYISKTSFDNTFKKLSPEFKENVKQAIQALSIFFESGQKTPGLGLKHLRRDFWEIRTGLKIRILFKFSSDLIEFIIVGTHDDIKRYLKSL
ncbi:MAG: hypothetical protein AB1629_04520 [Candidatus Omnitrophota bacterium]